MRKAVSKHQKVVSNSFAGCSMYCLLNLKLLCKFCFGLAFIESRISECNRA